MPTSIATPTLKDLRDQIKTEARLEGSNDLDDFLTGLINELLLDYSIKNRYFELLQLNLAIALTTGIESYPLPGDFFIEKLIRYQDSQGNTRSLTRRSEHLDNPFDGSTRYYEIANGNLLLMPSSRVQTGESLLLDYYQYPAKLAEETDVFPIPRLIAPVKQRAIFRAHIYNNQLQSASVLRGESVESEVRSKPAG